MQRVCKEVVWKALEQNFSRWILWTRSDAHTGHSPRRPLLPTSERTLIQLSTDAFWVGVSQLQWYTRKTPCNSCTKTGWRVWHRENTKIKHMETFWKETQWWGNNGNQWSASLKVLTTISNTVLIALQPPHKTPQSLTFPSHKQNTTIWPEVCGHLTIRSRPTHPTLAKHGACFVHKGTVMLGVALLVPVKEKSIATAFKDVLWNSVALVCERTTHGYDD